MNPERSRESFFRNVRLHEREIRALQEEVNLRGEAIWETVRRMVDHYKLTRPKTGKAEKMNDE